MAVHFSKNFGSFPHDDEKREKVNKFLLLPPPLSPETISSALSDLPFALRLNAFANWVRTHHSSDLVPSTLDSLYALSLECVKSLDDMPVATEKERDPIMDVFAAQQTCSTEVYDLLQFYTIQRDLQ